MTAKKVHVVAFDAEDSVAVIPVTWMTADGCCWPPYKGKQRIQRAVESEEMPATDWTCHGCRVLYSGSLIEAENRLRKAEETSDLQSDVDAVIPAKRKKIARRRLAELSDDTSENDDEPSTPAQPPIPSCSSHLPTPPQPLKPSSAPTPPPSLPVVQQNQPLPAPVTPSGIFVNRSLEARDTRLFTLLESMNEVCMSNNRLLRLLLARGVSGAETAAPSELPEGVVFPLQTVEDLDQFENQLNEETTASSVVRYLADLGGRNVNDTVGRILNILMENNLARQFNLKGLKGKRKFQGLNICDILFRCLRMNPITRQTNMKDMEAAITKWLGGARDRNGGRKSRENLRMSTLATPPPGLPDDTSNTP